MSYDKGEIVLTWNDLKIRYRREILIYLSEGKQGEYSGWGGVNDLVKGRRVQLERRFRGNEDYIQSVSLRSVDLVFQIRGWYVVWFVG